MSTAALSSVEEYLRTAYDPDCDYVDGDIIERNCTSGKSPGIKSFGLLRSSASKSSRPRIESRVRSSGLTITLNSVFPTRPSNRLFARR
jgi:hypothetical protein